MSVILRPYQNQQVSDLRDGFRAGHRRQLLVSPTGSGKTVVFSFMTSEAVKRGLRVMIMVHRAEILDQIDEMLRKFDIHPGHIRSGMPLDKTRPVLVASVQTLVRRFEVVPTPDLIIVDEAAHAAASQWTQVFARYSQAKFVGVTATPLRLDGRGLSDFFDHLVLGPEVQWLIDNGFLKRPIYIGTSESVDVSGIKKIGGEFNKAKLADAMDKRTITGDAVAHYRQFGRGMPAVAFTVNLRHAASVADQFNAAGIPAECIDGTMTPEERRDRKGRLASGATRVMVSCELISEGFDLPAVGCAILLRPTASLGLHLQQLGRALRPHPGQERAVILDHAGNTLRHGPAEEPREWSLEGNAAKKRKKDPVTETKQCPECFAIFQGLICPQCGAVKEVRQIRVQDGQLKEIDAGDLMRMRIGKRIEESKCRSFEDWKRIEVARGYKNGYAIMRWKNSRHYHARMHMKPVVESSQEAQLV